MSVAAGVNHGVNVSSITCFFTVIADTSATLSALRASETTRVYAIPVSCLETVFSGATG